MNLKPAEQWLKLENCPFDESHRIRLYRQIQADALIWALEEFKPRSSQTVVDKVNQLDPRPATMPPERLPKSI